MTNTKFIKHLIFGFSGIIATFSSAYGEDSVASGTCGTTCEWKIINTSDGGKELQISGSGIMTDYSWRSDALSPWYSYRNDITSAIVSGNFTHIGGAAFYNLQNLSNVDIPNSVTSMGAYVFSDTPNLKDIKLPENLRTIDRYAFQRNGSSTLILPSSVTSLGAVAFNGSSIEKIYCTEQQMGSGRFCNSANFSNLYYEGTVGHYEKDGDQYVIYDSEGNMTGIYADTNDFYKDNVVDSYTLNKNGMLTEYDGRGNIKSISKYDVGGNLIAQYDKNGVATYKRTSYTPAEAAAAVKKGNDNKITLTFK